LPSLEWTGVKAADLQRYDLLLRVCQKLCVLEPKCEQIFSATGSAVQITDWWPEVSRVGAARSDAERP